jgi:sterol desaturase/sphingolipid hydroxylase (fatty acid hydroxylase superfamily)
VAPSALHYLLAALQWVAMLGVLPAVLRASWPQLMHLVGGSAFGAMVWGSQLVHALVWLAANGLYAAVYAARPAAMEAYKVSTREWPWEGQPNEVAAFWARTRRSLAQIVFNNVVLALPLAAASATLSPRPNSISADAWPSHATFAWQLALFVLVEDFGFYWTHRALHTWPPLYRRVHSQHHQYRETVSWAAEDAHPVEYLLGVLLPFFAGPLLVRPHMAVMYAWVVLRVWITHERHSGFAHPASMWRLLPCIGGGREQDHELHHALVNKGNYGSSFAFWDSVAGTQIQREQVPKGYLAHEEQTEGTGGSGPRSPRASPRRARSRSSARRKGKAA